LDLGSRDLAGIAHRRQTHLDADGFLRQIHSRVLNRKVNRSSPVVIVVRWIPARRCGQVGERKESNLSRHRRLPPELTWIESEKTAREDRQPDGSKGTGSLYRQAGKREAGNPDQPLDFDMNFEFQWLKMLLAVAVAEEP